MQNWRLTVTGQPGGLRAGLPARNAGSYRAWVPASPPPVSMFGPYVCHGLDLRESPPLRADDPDDRIWVSAPGRVPVGVRFRADGRKRFVTFMGIKGDPLSSASYHLMYEQDADRPLTRGSRPDAIISEESGIVTEGRAWVKWVDRIEVTKNMNTRYFSGRPGSFCSVTVSRVHTDRVGAAKIKSSRAGSLLSSFGEAGRNSRPHTRVSRGDRGHGSIQVYDRSPTCTGRSTSSPWLMNLLFPP